MGGRHDWSGNRFFCLLCSHSLHTNYEVQDSLLSSLFGSGGEEEWQEAEKPVLLVCVDASLCCAKKRCRDLTSTASLGVAFPTISFHLQDTKSSERSSSCAQGNVGAAFLSRCSLVPTLQVSPAQLICLVASAAGEIHRMLLFREKECSSCEDKQHKHKCLWRETATWVNLCLWRDRCIWARES